MTAKNLCYIALVTALLTVCSWIAVPIGNIPVTLQTFGIFLSAGLLGTKRATFAIVAYLLLGFIGIPVFAGFTGGVGKLVLPTGGYLVGFLIAVPLSGWICGLLKKGFLRTLAAYLIGLVVCYVFGTGWFVALTAQQGSPIGIWSALLVCVFPYIPFDIAKLALAAFLTEKFKNKFVK